MIKPTTNQLTLACAWLELRHWHNDAASVIQRNVGQFKVILKSR